MQKSVAGLMGTSEPLNLKRKLAAYRDDPAPPIKLAGGPKSAIARCD